MASTRTVVLGSFAFLVFWVTATFPKFAGLPIGRTAGAITGAALVVVFQVDSPDEAYASVNLPILGLLFGTMVVSVYLQRADMFKYLASALSYRCRGGKDLICRLSFLVAFSSALFTNDTCCVLFTEFILAFCQEKRLPPEPFLLALATSANIGSSATPIGNPQNLVIAVQSKISFGKFLLGILPATLVGTTVNLGLLLAMHWKQLSNVTVYEGQQRAVDLPEVRKLEQQKQQSLHDLEQGKVHNLNVTDSSTTSKYFSSSGSGAVDLPDVRSLQSQNHQCRQELQESNYQNPTLIDGSGISKYCTSSDSDSVNAKYSNPAMQAGDSVLASCGTSSANQDNATEQAKGSLDLHGLVLSSSEGFAGYPVAEVRREERKASNMASPMSTRSFESPPAHVRVACNRRRFQIWKGRLRKLCVYLVALGMLSALLAGLNLSWSTITAAIALVVLDFKDAGPSLGKVSYSLLVFFSGMFITVDGFNRTGLPGKFWNVMEPHARINHASGTVVLTAVITLLSNVASNVPTVLLLGGKVAASSASIPGASETRAWLILAWASTVAGNLTLVGSAANLIVCEQARMAARMPYNLTFWRHLKFGFPSTLLTVAAGLPLIRG